MERAENLTRWKTFVSYCVVGAGSVAVQFGILTLFVEKLDLNKVFSSGSGFVIGCVFQYLLLYYWTFRSSSNHVKVALRYAIVLFFSFFLNLAFFWVFTEVVKWQYLLSQTVATSVVCLINFFFNKRYTFAV